MERKSQSSYFDDTSQQLVEKFEKMMRINHKDYFDVHEIELISDFYLSVNKNNKALAVTEYGITLHPSSQVLSYKKAQLLIESNRPNLALKLISRLLKIEPNNCDLLFFKGKALCMTGQKPKANKYFEEAIKNCYDNNNNLICNIAYAYESAEDYKMAISYFVKALTQSTKNSNVLYDLGYCHEKINDNKSSVYYYQKYLDLEPFSSTAWYNLGISYSKLNKNLKALEAFNYAVAISPDYLVALYNKATILFNLEKFSKQLKHILSIMSLSKIILKYY
jgi:tetratricopeptide (TPR) repeat protein